jgi:hypothetical protein
VKTAEVDEQKTKYLQHFINKHDTIVNIVISLERSDNIVISVERSDNIVQSSR